MRENLRLQVWFHHSHEICLKHTQAFSHEWKIITRSTTNRAKQVLHVTLCEPGGNITIIPRPSASTEIYHRTILEPAGKQNITCEHREPVDHMGILRSMKKTCIMHCHVKNPCFTYSIFSKTTLFVPPKIVGVLAALVLFQNLWTDHVRGKSTAIKVQLHILRGKNMSAFFLLYVQVYNYPLISTVVFHRIQEYRNTLWYRALDAIFWIRFSQQRQRSWHR